MPRILLLLCLTAVLAGCAGKAPVLGLTNGQLSPCPSTPNCVNTQAVANDNNSQALYFTGSQAEAKERLLMIINSMKRSKIIENRQDYIRAEYRSALFRFVDDVEFYFPAQEDGKIIVHMRSASRLGLSDLGVNKKRLSSIKSQFEAVP